MVTTHAQGTESEEAQIKETQLTNALYDELKFLGIFAIGFIATGCFGMIAYAYLFIFK